MVVLAAAAGMILSTTRAARSQLVDPNFWVANGPVTSVVRDGSTIYIGGDFTRVGPATGGGVPLDMSTAAPLGSFPKVAGVVRAIVPDGTGGWFLGGSFTSVGGLPRNNVARVTASMSVSSWNPNATGQYGYVDAIVPIGSLVYIGGSFSSIGGQARNNLAAIDTTTGLATSWDPNPGSVLAMVASGSTIYVGGKFTSIGGQSRNRIAAFDATTGVVSGWNPNSDSDVYALAVDGSKVYAGGYFTNIGGQPRSRIAELESVSGNALAWDPNASQPVYSLAVSGSIVYAGGDFVTIGGQSRRAIAALDSTAGAATAWNANCDGPVYAVRVSGSVVYASGNYTTIGGQARSSLAALNAGTALATAWNPNLATSTVDPTVFTLGVAGTTVYAGGNIVSAGGQVRNNIAAIAAATGALTTWNPGANGLVRCIALSGPTTYVGGDFTSIGGQSRNRIAALDGAGNATGWNAGASAGVWAIAINGSTVYAGGVFDFIGGQTRSYVAALDTSTGAASGWNPNADNGVNALVVRGSTVYVGGSFHNIGGQTRNYIAALDQSTGAATAWDPNSTSHVVALAVDGPVVYAGGPFTSIGGQLRNYIAAIDASTGLATAWNPSADNFVNALAANGTTIYAGGLFTTIGGQSRNFVAALDANTGSATPWDPGISPSNPYTRVWPAGPTRPFSLAALATGATVYLGGEFLGAGGFPQAFVAATEPALAIAAVAPASGGNAAAITPTITGTGFKSGATVRLTRSGQADIAGTGVVVASDGLSISATFDVAGKALGSWDVVVTNPDLQTATLTSGFTITEFAPPQLRVGIVGPSAFRTGYPASYDLVIQNPGNVDALSVPLWIAGIPNNASVTLGFTLSAPPQDAGEPDWSLVQDTLSTAAGRYLALVIPRVPPGTTTRRVSLTVLTTPTFQLTAALTPPWADGNVLRTCLSDGGVITNTACMGNQLTAINAYLAIHPEIEALNGIALWAKVGWQCEGAGSPTAALAKARQVLNLMAKPVEQVGSVPSSCSQVLAPRWREVLGVTVGGSIDPNAKFGDVANGAAIGVDTWLPYTVQFENLSTALYPAQHVTVSDPLDSDLDPATVSIGRIRFGAYYRDPSPSARFYSSDVPINATLGVHVSFNLVGSQLVWDFQTYRLDHQPLGPNDGFLPPNDAQTNSGQGSVQFTVRSRSTSTNGTAIANVATLTFDTEMPRTTQTVANTVSIPAAPLASHVTTVVPNSGALSHTVSWTADSPNVAYYTVCVAEDGGPYRDWRNGTTVTTDTLGASSDHHPHTYTFYSVARDPVGNLESIPGGPDVTIASQVAVDAAAPWTLALEGARPNPALGGSIHVRFTLANQQPATLELIDIAGRRVIRRDVGSLGPGPHVAALGALPLRSGLYFLRLAQGDRRLQSKVVIMK